MRAVSSQLATVVSTMSSFSTRLENVEGYVNQSSRSHEDTSQQSAETGSEQQTLTNQQSWLWCNTSLNELLPTGPLVWPDKEETDGADEADGCQLHRVTATTAATLTEAFSKPVANATRRRGAKSTACRLPRQLNAQS